MNKYSRSIICVLLTLVLLVGGLLPVMAAEEYRLTSTTLKVGSTTVATTDAATTLYLFKPTRVGYYRVTVDDPNAVLSFWYGTAQYVSQPADLPEGDIILTCTAVGQRMLVGLAGVDSATITITAESGYMAPPQVVYETYKNKHRVSRRFSLSDEPLTAVDITKKQTVVADSQGIYHLGDVNGPILYVNMRASVWTDLYKLFYPDDVEGEEWPPIDTMRGRHEEKNGKIYSYDFVEAMADYADALDENGYYYLTVDLANMIQMYGRDQGWFVPRYSPFAPIQNGEFIQESAWLVNTYYVAEEATPGDLNGNGKANTQDLALLQQHLNGWDVAVDTDAADVTGDGKVNTQDLALLQRYLNGWDVTLK